MKPMTEEEIKEIWGFIQDRWHQAHRHESFSDWDGFITCLVDMADKTVRHEDEELASDLYFLAGLAYQRSLDFLPCYLRMAA